ncbi:MAG: copper chaperone [Geobacter sp.]|nr:copper chaperone [Geobacter sp.]
MKNKTVNILIIATAVTLLALLAYYVKVGVAADSVAVLKTTGMTCGSCSSKISKALEALKGVVSTEVDVEGGWVVVGYDKKSIKPEVLADKVKSVGFGSSVHLILSPEQFKQITGKDIGSTAPPASGCCGGKGGGCGTNNKS